MSSNEERLAFCAGAPISPVSAEDARLVLESLTRGPEGIIDAREGEGRLVAGVVEASETPNNAAMLIVLGVAGPPSTWAPLFAEAVERGVELLRSSRRTSLLVPLAPALETLAPVLAERGFREAYATYTMTAPQRRFAPLPMPEGLRFVDWTPEIGAAPVDALTRRAYGDTPGIIMLSLEGLRDRLTTSRPTPRLLYAGDELAGVCRTHAPDAAGGAGVVQLIARDPARRGEHLGDLLLGEAQRVLAEAGAGSFRLEVVVTNRRALALYERHGFVIESTETTWSSGPG